MNTNYNEKYQYFLDQRIDMFKKHIETFAKKKFELVKIEKTLLHYPTDIYEIIFTFDKFLNYYHKNKLTKYLFNQVKPIYENYLGKTYDNERDLCYDAQFWMYFIGNKVTNPSYRLKITFNYTAPNRWKAIAIDETAIYLPKLGHKKNELSA